MVEKPQNSLWGIDTQGRRGSLASDALPGLPSADQVRQQAIELDREFQEELIEGILGQTVE